LSHQRRAAIFDLDGTVIAGSSERVFFRTLLSTRFVRVVDLFRWAGTSLLDLPKGVDAAIRGNRRYLRGKRVADIVGIAEQTFTKHIRPQIADEAFRAVETHRSQGDFIVLLSGSLRILAEPVGMALGVDAVAASELEAVGDVLTGRLASLHPIGDGKSKVAERLASNYGFDLSASAAYADRPSDIALLSRVAEPIAVSPVPALRRHAERHGWHIVEWHAR
jgi:HAD superfamily hydrolase (TIGR01490 family)